ncbi:hypothetical protein [Streptomyces sp. NBC_01353]|uniref:hypothetical protein n=1 Tax=Streptomyces sp. NBC_01353 TaxID=2903835 RepID=UPI002E345E08|nr:hypothetical protein [Streptomyces sp. NBC_01353]
MAVSTIQPYPLDQDLVTYEEAKHLFAETGHPVSVSTMRRWGVNTAKLAGIVYVSFSDLLVAHGDWVTRGTIP